MAETLLSFGVQKLWDLLARESDRLQGFDEQFEELKRDLNLLRSFLEDADAKKHTNKMVKTCVEEIKEIVFDAEDIIETFLLKKELGQTSGIRKRMRRLSCIVVDHREIALDMGSISKRISKVICNMQSFGVQHMAVDGGEYSHPLQERQREMRKTFPSNNDNDLVGLEDNVKELVGYLVEEDSIQVVSITGMGGIGKTTLARQVFNHEMVKNHFDGVAWVCISQQFTRKYVWETIFQKLSSKHVESNMTEDDLQEKLFRLLETSNSLIVLDDMWREEDWDRIKPVFPPRKGWKVLLTSRNENVALHADPRCVTFKPKCLTIEESWTLFRRIAFPIIDSSEYNIDEEMQEMGKKLIKHCGGLPLGVKVLGGLSAARHTLSEWKRIYENIKSHIVGGTSFNDRNVSSVYHILYLSFEELPVYLKQCFLYLAHFPEDCVIDVEKLSYYWAAEGIPRPKYYDEATIREVSDGCMEELVKRNMVISEQEIGTSIFKTCRLHDMVREVCLLKAEEENFLQIVDGTITATSKSPCKSRRLAVHLHDKTYHMKGENPKLRSLLIIKKQFSVITWMALGLCFTKLQLMRVLDLSQISFGGKLPSDIGKLIHLRYLSLCMANVSHLPSSMRNLKQLLYLNLHVSARSPIYMAPNFLKEMRELAYLCLPWEMHDKTKLELGNLVNLETLENFSTKHSSVEDLQLMTKLRNLSISIKGKGCNMETLSSSLSELRHLEDLRIHDFTYNKKGLVLDCVKLKKLHLSIYMPRLPDEQHFPSHLTTISLKYCRLVEDPMPILEKVLQLKELVLGYESFYGRRMVCSNGGFLQLQKLELDRLHWLEEWMVEEGSMPLLHSLTFSDCPKLKELPNGFPQLQKLELEGLEEWEEWIVEEGSMPLLHSLTIRYCAKLKKLPDGQHFPSHLTIICLRECPLVEDPMPILEKLLHLKEVSLHKSFSGRKMVCSSGGLSQLEEFTIAGLEEWEEWIVEEGSMPLLHSLNISDCPKLKKLPDGQHFPSHLTTIDLCKCPLVEDPMPILEKLLDLKEVILPGSFVGKRMVCSNGGFPQLQKLHLYELKELEEWIVEEGSMPLLHSLFISGCNKLKELPDGLRFIYSLKLLMIGGSGWEVRLSERGEDYYKVQHIPHVHFY